MENRFNTKYYKSLRDFCSIGIYKNSNVKKLMKFRNIQKTLYIFPIFVKKKLWF